MKITHLAYAGVLLISPLLAHSQSASFNLKDVLKKSIAEGTAKGSEAGKGGTANAAVDNLAEGQSNGGGPKVMETFGIKIGDTPQQVEKVLSGQGYSASLGESPNSGKEFRSIEVIVADFSQMTVEWAASRAMMERKDAEVLEEHKKAPVPKL